MRGILLLIVVHSFYPLCPTNLASDTDFNSLFTRT